MVYSRCRRARWAITLPQLWVVVVLCLPIVVALSFPLSSIDLTYHLRAGDLREPQTVFPIQDLTVAYPTYYLRLALTALPSMKILMRNPG